MREAWHREVVHRMEKIPRDPSALWRDDAAEMSDELLVSIGKARLAAQEKKKN
jgi:hypothetical protein